MRVVIIGGGGMLGHGPIQLAIHCSSWARMYFLSWRAERTRSYPCRNGALQCPLLAISRHPEGSSRTSALPPKADIQTAKSRHCSLDVRCYPKSGHKWLWRGMSAFDPLRTLAHLALPRTATGLHTGKAALLGPRVLHFDR